MQNLNKLNKIKQTSIDKRTLVQSARFLYGGAHIHAPVIWAAYSVCWVTDLAERLSVCLFVCLSVCLSACLSLFLLAGVSLFLLPFFAFLYLSDIDECTDGSALCKASSTVCQNNAPGYECRCKDGYRPINGEKYKCEGNVNKLFYLIIVSVCLIRLSGWE